MPPTPLISVVVVAHDRSEFLDEALRSAANQTLDRNRYELILVKNFRDPNIDRLCDELNIDSVFTDAGPLSQKILEGVRRGRGEIFTFLDYDDRYVPSRLQCVTSEFQKDPSLGFMHNGLEFIDSEGRPITEGLKPSFRLMTRYRRRVVIGDAAKRQHNPRVGNARPGLNVGAMAVRREVLDLAKPYLARISLTVDSLLYYAGWTAPFTVLVDPRKLTQYRLHSSNVSVATGMSKGDALSRQVDYRQTRKQDFSVMLELVKEGGRVELLRDLGALALCDQVLEDLRGSTLRRRDAGRQLYDLSKYLWPGSLSLMLLQTTEYAASATFSPALGRRLALQAS